MHLRFSLIIIMLAFLCCPFAAEAQAYAHHHAHSSKTTKATASKKKKHIFTRHRTYAAVGAPSYSDIVIDAKTGVVLHTVDPDSLRHPASLTKMMVLYIAFQALESGQLRLDQWLPVSAKAAMQSPSKLGLREGRSILVKDVIMGMVTESANDAAVVLAEALGGNTANFANLMTEQAHALGMTSTQFDNPSGLPDANQITTARDMSRLALALIYHYPNFYPYFSHASFSYNGINYHNHNHLMERYPGMDGIKTGYIQASGFNLVASAVQNNHRLIGVVFGGRSAPSRDKHMADLLNQAFAMDAPDATADLGYVSIPPKNSVVFTPGNGRVVTLSLPPHIKIAAASHAKSHPSEHINNGGNSGDWGVQIGAFSSAAAGHRTLTRLIHANPKLLNHTSPVVQAVNSRHNHHLAYRARLMGVDKKTALSICRQLSRQGQTCITVG